MSASAPTSPKAPFGMSYLGPHTGTEPLDITVVLRRRAGATQGPAAWPHARLPRAQFAQHCGADPADLASLRRFAQQHGLTETGADLTRRVLNLRATPAALQGAFGVTLGSYRLKDGRGPFMSCTVAPALPPQALAILGLDRRPVARPQFRRPRATPAQTYTPLQVGALYDYPAGTDGTGEAIAIIELGGGFSQSDFTTYFSQLGIAAPTVTIVPVDGATNSPGTDTNADAEVMLDVEVAGGVAPGAKLVMYIAPNTDQGFIDAVSSAVNDAANKPGIISISWGGPESTWTGQATTAFNQVLENAANAGITVCVASGDSGSSDGVSDGSQHVDFPASSPYVLGCGGTSLQSSGTTISSETVWNSNGGASGGGISNVFAVPTWQSKITLPVSTNGGKTGRGVPDVAADADPSTGYSVLVDGTTQVIGGTSAAAPLWAGLTALLNQSLGKNVGFLNPQLYALSTDPLRDIVTGNNGSYSAAPGWDACTGWGSPNGVSLLAALRGG